MKFDLYIKDFNLPVWMYLISHFLFCTLGALLLLDIDQVGWVYEYFSGVKLPYLNDEELYILYGLLILSPIIFTTTGVSAKVFVEKWSNDLSISHNLNFKLLVIFHLFSLVVSFYSLYKCDAWGGIAAWFNHEEWIAMRWHLFKELSFFEFVNLYTFLPISIAMLSLNVRSYIFRTALMLGGLFLTIFLYQKKQFFVFLILVILPMILNKLSKIKLSWVLGMLFSCLLVFIVVATIPAIDLSNKDGDLSNKDGIELVKKSDCMAQKLDGPFTSISRDELYCFIGLKLHPVKRHFLFLANALLFRTSPVSIFYISEYPKNLSYSGVNLPFDNFSPNDNREIWKKMWPNTPGGSVMAPFQFSLFSQVGYVGSFIFLIFYGWIIFFTYFFLHKILPVGIRPIWISIHVLLMINLSMDSFLNSYLSSYGMIWAQAFILFISSVSILLGFLRDRNKGSTFKHYITGTFTK